MSLSKQKSSGFFSKAFNLPYLNQTRLKWVDYVKGIAIVLVVYRHVLIGIERSGINIPSYMVTANMIFYSFRMPLFFILSGLFINASLQKKTFKELFSIKLETLIYPYFIWVFLQVTTQIIFTDFTNSSRGLIDYTYIFYLPRELDQFWYLPALFNVTLVYAFIKSKLNPPVFFQIVFGLALYFTSPYLRDISIISDWMEFYVFFAVGDAVSHFLLNTSNQQKLKSPLLLVLSFPVFIFIQLYYLSKPESYFTSIATGRTEYIFIALAGCFMMIVFSLFIENFKQIRFLRIIGLHSLYIYVMHVFVFSFIRIILMKFLHIANPFVLLLSGITISIPVCIMIYNLLIKENILWFLFSFRKKQSITTNQKAYEQQSTR